MTSGTDVNGRRKRLSPLKSSAVISALLVVPAAVAWVHMRPRVMAISEQGVGVYAEGAATQVFGSDIAFAVVTAGVAFFVAVAAAWRARSAHMSAGTVLLGALVQVLGAGLTLAVGPIFDGVGASWNSAFPPARLAQGATAIEPARLHAFGVLAAAPLMWLSVVLLATLVRSSKP